MEKSKIQAICLLGALVIVGNMMGFCLANILILAGVWHVG